MRKSVEATVMTLLFVLMIGASTVVGILIAEHLFGHSRTVTVIARLENVTWEYHPRLIGPDYVANLTFVDQNNETYTMLVDDHYEYWRSFIGKWFELTVKVHRDYKEILSIKYLGNETEVK